jgi:hypothetical protein
LGAGTGTAGGGQRAAGGGRRGAGGGRRAAGGGRRAAGGGRQAAGGGRRAAGGGRQAAVPAAPAAAAAAATLGPLRARAAPQPTPLQRSPPQDEWQVKGGGGQVFEAADLRDDWADYDEKLGDSVTVMGVEARFELHKGK